jgi:hypothetical protein
VSGQLHALAALPPGKVLPLPVGWETGRAPEQEKRKEEKNSQPMPGIEPRSSSPCFTQYKSLDTVHRIPWLHLVCQFVCFYRLNDSSSITPISILSRIQFDTVKMTHILMAQLIRCWDSLQWAVCPIKAASYMRFISRRDSGVIWMGRLSERRIGYYTATKGFQSMAGPFRVK